MSAVAMDDGWNASAPQWFNCSGHTEGAEISHENFIGMAIAIGANTIIPIGASPGPRAARSPRRGGGRALAVGKHDHRHACVAPAQVSTFRNMRTRETRGARPPGSSARR